MTPPIRAKSNEGIELIAPIPTKQGEIPINLLESYSTDKFKMLPTYSESHSTFSWEKFWESVDGLLSILPKPLFEEDTFLNDSNDLSTGTPATTRANVTRSDSFDDFFIVPYDRPVTKIYSQLLHFPFFFVNLFF